VEPKVNFVPSGSVTSPRGFLAGATCAKIKEKTEDRLDLGVLFSEVSCVATAMFTTNKIKAAPVALSQRLVKSGTARAVVANSGCANACTGERGLADAAEMAELVARSRGVSPEDVLVASTGVIGEHLPMPRIRDGIGRIVLSRDGGHDLARAIMTTDTVPKEVAVTLDGFTIGGAAKGSGMIHPQLGTMLCFLTTDAAVEQEYLKAALRKAVDISFNMVSIDGDTSPNDMVLILANGLAGKPESQDDFQEALNQVCTYLAKNIARDGEGASRLIEVTVDGAASLDDARLAARTVVSSPLVKSAVHGGEPNWGRIMAAVGRSGAEVEEAKVDLYIGNVCLVQAGQPLPFDKAGVVETLKEREVPIALNLNLGTVKATAWGCDLSEEYVTINSEYTT